MNKFDEAINNYKCCINEDPNYAPAYHHIGLIFLKKVKDYKTSELYLKKGIFYKT
ncbi:tetratricopeptide repeat protein [Escherichia coli]|nr:tetratricopeptide repeat protein [Escherichia coli]